MKSGIKFVCWLLLGILVCGCKKALEVKPKLALEGNWKASYTMASSSFVDDYKTYKWSADLSLEADGSAKAVHQQGNPIFYDKEVVEFLNWGKVDETTFFLRSKSWSVTSRTMNYEVREYGINYIRMEGFDDNLQFWTLVLRK